MVEASNVKPWRKAIADSIRRAWAATADERPFSEPVVVYATFYLPRPKSVTRLFPTVAPDLDKLCRALGDAMSIDCAALADDSLIVKWHATKLYADRHDAGVRVAVKTVALLESERANGPLTDLSDLHKLIDEL